MHRNLTIETDTYRVRMSAYCGMLYDIETGLTEDQARTRAARFIRRRKGNPNMTEPKLDAFTRAYLTAALWTSDPDPRSGEYAESDWWNIAAIDPASLTRAIDDCARFQREQADLLAQAGDDEQNGHDYWLTRNRHGAGFWARGYPKPIGDALTTAAHAYGERYVNGPELSDGGDSASPEQLATWDGVIYID